MNIIYFLFYVNVIFKALGISVLIHIAIEVR